MHRILWVLSGLSILVLGVAVIFPPIAQPIDYHQFADQRNFLNIPNFYNVVSNLGFLFSGAAGWLFLLRAYHSPAQTAFRSKAEFLPYWILFFSVIASAFGSIFYHWVPDNDYLLWDRLPIAIGVTALLAATLVERVGAVLGLWLLPMLTALGIWSVLHWYWTEQAGAGNLNFYIVTQFYSILLIVLLSGLCQSCYTHANYIYQVIGLYAVAKLTEMLDMQIYHFTSQLISGHTIKHLLAAFAVYRIVRMLKIRAFLPESI